MNSIPFCTKEARVLYHQAVWILERALRLGFWVQASPLTAGYWVVKIPANEALLLPLDWRLDWELSKELCHV